MPNFDEISQSTAEIKLLPVSEKGRPPYWNCASGFNFDEGGREGGREGRKERKKKERKRKRT